MTKTTELAHALNEKRSDARVDLKHLFWKVRWRILPLLFLSYGIAYLDRVNIGFTQLQMGKAIGLDPAQYGFAAGIFFVSYALFELPSNLLFQRLGARKTFLRIMMLWGGTVIATAFVTGPLQFYIARLLLGVFEAGFFPGMILYLTYWFPSSERARVTTVVFAANMVAAAVAGPLTTSMMAGMEGLHGMHGWRWVFLLQGLPACLLGVVCYFILPDTPQSATWLNADEKQSLTAALTDDRPARAPALHGVAATLLKDPIVWALILVYFSASCTNYLFSFWLPTILRESGVPNLIDVGLLATLPMLSAVLGMLLVNWSSDYFRERRIHLAIAFLLAILGLLAVVLLRRSPAVLIVCFCLANFGTGAIGPLFWTLPPTYLGKREAAAGVALVSLIGALAGFVSPALFGYLKARSGGFTVGIDLLLVMLGISLIVVLRVLPGSAVRVGRA